MTCLRSGDQEHWEILVQQLQPIFARTIYRVVSIQGATLRSDEVDDLIQECFLKLAAIREGPANQQARFADEQSAVAYWKVLAANTARDYFKKRKTEKRGGGRTIPLEDWMLEIVGPAAAHADESALISQIDRILRKVTDARGRAIFWLCYKQGFTAKEIAAIPAFCLSTKGVESLIQRLKRAVREGLNPQPEGIFDRETF